jgi:HEAT repeat protein
MLTPATFSQASTYELLEAAAQGRVGIDRRWAQAILDRGESAIADMLRFGLEDRSNDPIGLDEDLMLFFQHYQTPEAVPYYIKYLRIEPSDVPDGLADALFPVRHEALDPLIALYRELDEEDAGDIAFLLASFRIYDERVLEILTDRLEYDITDGAICLGLYGDPAARPALEKWLADVQEDEHLAIQVRQAIEELGRGPEEDVRQEFDILEDYPDTALPETEVLSDEDLREMLKSEDPDYRFAAAAAHMRRELDEASRERLLETAQGDSEAFVRAKAWESLAGLVDEDEEVYGLMLKRLQDTGAPMLERAGALAGLGQRADEDPIRQYAIEFYGNPETRAAALSAMWNSLDRSYSTYFTPHVDDPDPDIRKQAISGVGYLGIHESAEKLRQYFEDEDLRANALFAYALSARCEISPARIRSLYRRIEQFAGGFSEEEEELVRIALDERLMLHGHKPVYHADEERHHEHGPECDHGHAHDEAGKPAVVPAVKAGRNDPCPCGSGKKYKKCCGA